MSRAALALVGLAGCASSYQSARVLAPGRTEVTVGTSRISFHDDADEATSGWLGDLQVRHGVADRVELGVRLDRTPGTGEAISALTFDPKVELTAPGAKTAVSAALPIALGWAEESADPEDFQDGVLVIAPSLYVGVDVSPTAELVVSPRIPIYLPEGETEDLFADLAVGIGLRLHDPTRSWAVHPELVIGSFGLIGEDGDAATMISIGLGVSAAR